MVDTVAAIKDIFKKFDTDGDGVISKDELKRIVRAISKDFSDGAVDALLEASDTNKDGFIQYEEFLNWMTQDLKKDETQDLKKDEFKPLDERGIFQVDYRKLLPQRFDIDLKDRYELDKLDIGAGGFGKFFVARDNEFPDRKVAVKRVQKPHAKSPAMVELNRETEVKKELDHPNISKVLATFDDGRSMYFIMELCEGGAVLEKMVRCGLESERTVALIIAQVVAALSYAHGRQIVHGNIKSENVLFCSQQDDDLRIKVIDWAGDSAVATKTYAAPEVLASQDQKPAERQKIKSPEACDIWSMGVLTYVMLSGTAPFLGTRQQHHKDAMAERYPFKGEPWDRMNPDAKDFVQSLLKAAPAKRMTLKGCLSHGWLATRVAVPAESSSAVMSNLKSFCAKSTFSRMCITAVARQLDHKHLKDIHQVFKEMDKDCNGVLSVEEITQGFGGMGNDTSDVAKVFAQLDSDGSHTIDYTEFCAAALDENASNQRDVIWAAFKTFDLDNSGSISVEELSKILDSTDVKNTWSAEVCSEVGAKIVARFDRQGDGKIDFAEWEKLMEQCWSEKQPDEKGQDGNSIINAYDLLKIAS